MVPWPVNPTKVNLYDNLPMLTGTASSGAGNVQSNAWLDCGRSIKENGSTSTEPSLLIVSNGKWWWYCFCPLMNSLNSYSLCPRLSGLPPQPQQATCGHQETGCFTISNIIELLPSKYVPCHLFILTISSTIRRLWVFKSAQRNLWLYNSSTLHVYQNHASIIYASSCQPIVIYSN